MASGHLWHKHRGRLLKPRTQLSNQIRGFLYELGMTLAKGALALKSGLPQILDEKRDELAGYTSEMLAEMWLEYRLLDERIARADARMKAMVQANQRARELLALPGVGPITASALVATLAGYSFEKGRQTSAWMGLTPRECSSGEQRRLLGISKQGNHYLRYLLIHGARAVVSVAGKKEDRLSVWINKMVEKKGFNKTVVALANKTARRAWSMLAHQTRYDENFADHYQWTA